MCEPEIPPVPMMPTLSMLVLPWPWGLRHSTIPCPDGIADGGSDPEVPERVRGSVPRGRHEGKWLPRFCQRRRTRVDLMIHDGRVSGVAMTEFIAEVGIPGTDIAAEATRLVRDTTSPLLY